MDDMTIDDVIEVLQLLVFNSYGRITPKEQYAISRAIDLIKCRSVKNSKEIYEMAKCLRPLTSIEKMFFRAVDEAVKDKDKEIETLKTKLCDSSEYCEYCDELDMSERDWFTCKYKKKKIPAVCQWQTLTPVHFDDIPPTKNEALKLIGDTDNGINKEEK